VSPLSNEREGDLQLKQGGGEDFRSNTHTFLYFMGKKEIRMRGERRYTGRKGKGMEETRSQIGKEKKEYDNGLSSRGVCS